VTYQSGGADDRGWESGGDLDRGDTVELTAFGAGVLATATAAAVAGWRLLTLVIGGG
jgi:hypothetical protein